MIRSLLVFSLAAACAGCTVGGAADASVDARPAVDAAAATCAPGAGVCDGFTHYVCGADGRARLDERVCPGACADTGCTECLPGQWRCDGDISTRCDADGSWAPVRDCSERGVACGPAGACDDACGEAALEQRNVGCELWAAPLANLDGTGELDFERFDFRVVVANPNAEDTRVRVFAGARQLASRVVGAGRLEVISLPWVDGQSRWTAEGRGFESFAVANGAYRIESEAPITAFQFNPFDYEDDGRLSFSNDATLLLPTHALSGDYVGVSFLPAAQRLPGYLALLGVQDETTVTITPSAPLAAEATGRFARADAGDTVQLTLGRGEVVHLLPEAPPECTPARAERCEGDACHCLDRDHDLTGTRVRADRPLALFGGHVCAYVPSDVGACDHLEAQIPPLETWGRHFVATPLSEDGSGRRSLLRLVAGQDDVLVRISPALDGISEVAVERGAHRDLAIGAAHELSADQAFLAATYMVGQHDAPVSERGDPSMTVLIPLEQLGDDYLFVAPSSFGDAGSHLALVRPAGASLTLDGAPLSASWRPLGAFEVARVQIGSGPHHLVATQPVSAVSFGLGRFTSYAYPSGIRLQRINLF